jgi:hypothetical protein
METSVAQITEHGWITPSSKGESHYILTTDGGTIACTCKGFQYRNTCRHSLALQERLGLDLKAVPSAWLEPKPEPEDESAKRLAELY